MKSVLKKDVLGKDWIMRTVRIRESYFPICSFLMNVYPYITKKDSEKISDDIINWAIDYLLNNELSYFVDIYKPGRKNKGFPISIDTNNKLNDVFKEFSEEYRLKYNRRFYMAEFMELLIYIYSINHLSEEQIKLFIQDWEIKVVKK